MDVEIYEKPLIRFGPYEIDVSSGELRKGGSLIKLPPQPLRILILLARHAGDVVTRDEIQRQIWDSETFVDFEQGLNSCIRQIRAALNDDPESPRYIETLPRRGYRFIHSVESAARPAAESTPQDSPADGLPGYLQAAPSPRAPHAPQAKDAETVLVNVKVWIWAAAGALAVLVLFFGGWYLWNRWPPGPEPVPGRIMLAVLPFENLTGDENQQFLSDGLTEEMITQLGRLYPRGLGVIARTSAMQYRSSGKSVEQIGRELGVQYVLEGSFRRDADRIRINVKLIQVADQTQLWAETLEEEVGDAVALQNEIARRIARSLALELLPDQGDVLARVSTRSTAAYEAYLQGRYAWNRRTAASLQESVSYFRRAMDLDPDYALAHVGLALSYMLLADYRLMPPSEAFPEARKLVVRALEIDPALAEGYAARGVVRAFYDWEWQAAEEDFRRAIELNPSNAMAHHWYSYCLRSMGRMDEALQEARRAVELDPQSPISRYGLTMFHYQTGQYDQAVRVAQEAISTDAAFPLSWLSLGIALAELGRYDQALAALDRASELGGAEAMGQSAFLGPRGYIYARAGRSEEARRILMQLDEQARREYVAPLEGAYVLVGLGEHDAALERLERAAVEHTVWMRNINIDPRFTSLRGHPRFRAVLRKLNLPD